MKKLKTQKKLSKTELKQIKGGEGPCYEGFCHMPGSIEWIPGAGDRNGDCCYM
ncbi:bacteriocin [Chryseobacterium paridis]|uniref:Bacteriocin n=1 Tax=Chryseobacterium paridis TaxID=2800328 RepID=A0ABS1FQJ2_9FLAO|nr:bacteriocin [Chryseobacterium paridis]MBK1894682.1 bacteriocin [Chryseobacterium paridis]